MRRLFTAAVFAAALVPAVLPAQRTPRATPDRGFQFFMDDDDHENRAVIGISTSGGSIRDTLGVLVSGITSGSPAERAGIEEGNRIAAVNGVNLRLAPADADDEDMSGLMTRRLTRELGKVKPGDEVELRLYSGGQTRSLKVKTVAYDSLYRRRRMWNDDEDRAVLGLNLESSGSKRDTLGVLVSWLDDEGPAVKAGIVEGNRIAAINGVDVRVRPEDAGDDFVSGAKVERLRRELAKLKPGDEVELRVYGDGRVRTLKVKTVAASSLESYRSMHFEPGVFSLPRIRSMAPMPPMPPVPSVPGRMRVRVSSVTTM